MTNAFRRQFGLLLLVAAVILAAGIGLRDPWPADEPRFALIAKEMVETGHWLFPHVGGVLYPDKPPLFLWFVAAVYWLTGSIRVAILAPGFIAGIGTLVLVTDLARRLWNEQTAIYCGAVLLAILQFPLQMKAGQIDGLLCLWTTLSLYGLCRHLLIGPDWRWYAIGGVAAGLGIITKGVGFLPYLVLLPYLFAANRGWPGVARPVAAGFRWLIAPAATLFVVLLWLVPMLMAVAGSGEPGLEAYRDNILFHQTVTRYADSWGHIKPPWYLLTNAIPWLWLPVTLALPWLVPAWYRDLRNRNAAVLLLGGWVLLVVLFFSLSDGKRSLYIFPAAPALALIAGLHAANLLERAGVRRVLLGFCGVLGLLVAALGLYALVSPYALHDVTADEGTIRRAGIAVLVTGALMLAGLLVVRRKSVDLAVAATLVAFWTGTGLLVAPQINAERSGRALLDALDHHVGPDVVVGFLDWPEQFVLQWGRPLVHFGYRQPNEPETRSAADWLAGGDYRRVLLPEALLGDCIRADAAEHVGYAHRRNWYLAAPDAVDPACALPSAGDAVVINYPADTDGQRDALKGAAKDFAGAGL